MDRTYDWWSVGLYPDVPLELDRRDDAQEILEDHGISATEPYQIFYFVHGTEQLFGAFTTVDQGKLMRRYGRQAQMSLFLASTLASASVTLARRQMITLVPGHGQDQYTVQSIIPGVFYVEHWGRYRLVPPLAEVIAHRAQHEHPLTLVVSSEAEDHDATYCILQGARWVANEIAAQADGDDRAVWLTERALTATTNHHLLGAHPEAIREALAELG